MNWHEFFKRLTIVTSILIIPITVIVCEATDRWVWWVNTGVYIVIGLLNAIIVWILYFLIRWIVRGLKK